MVRYETDAYVEECSELQPHSMESSDCEWTMYVRGWLMSERLVIDSDHITSAGLKETHTF
ncbi:uncharacterized protein BDV14DRAFT_126047 [Aspergillus stella-maris]|uniref:uncharacterized protein n=1 Tax=Aspergillus stella-maris TaxID=1810926 RepID=UPI003CCD0038